MKSRSFTIKLFFCFCLLIFFSVLVPSVYFLHNLREESIELITEATQREAAFVQGYLHSELKKRGVAGIDELPKLLRNFYTTSDHRMTLIDDAGNVLYDSFFSGSAKQLDNHLEHDEVEMAFASGSATSVRMSTTMHERFVYAAHKLYRPDGKELVVRVSAPLSLVEAYALDRRRALLFGGTTAFLFACAFAAFFAIRFRRSLRHMVASVESLATPGIRSGRINVRTLPGDEFAPLAGAVNSMSKRMEEQVGHILTQKAQLDAVLNSIAEGVLVIDHEGRVRSVNASLIHLFPRTAHAEGLLPFDVIPEPALQESIDAVKQAMPDKPLKFDMDTESGRKLRVHVCPIVGEVKMLMAVAVFHDITDISVLMEMRRDFVANVSHELRTPLTAIMGYAESLKRYVSEPRGQRFLEVIDRNSQYMATMVKDLLHLSSIENGSIPMDMRPVPASMVLRSGIDLCRTLAESRHLEFREELKGGEIPDFSINGDPEFLSRVMRNLLENACHYAPEASIITLSVEALPRQGVALFRIADKGPGIPPELRLRVFERFFRVEKHRGGQVSTGLGLSICKHIIERHGGRIYVDEGEGCVMCFTVPLA